MSGFDPVLRDEQNHNSGILDAEHEAIDDLCIEISQNTDFVRESIWKALEKDDVIENLVIAFTSPNTASRDLGVSLFLGAASRQIKTDVEAEARKRYDAIKADADMAAAESRLEDEAHG